MKNAVKQASFYRALRGRLLPSGSRRLYLIEKALKSYQEQGWTGLLAVLTGLMKFLVKAVLLRLTAPRGPFKVRGNIEEFSQVTLYTDGDLFPAYRPRQSLTCAPIHPVAVSLITTVKDECGSADAWWESLLAQSRLPDEVVVVDGGSDDGTLERLRDLAANSPFPMAVLSEPGANIARGRNIAISQARHGVIACTDFGCRMRPDWLQNLIKPFEQDPETQVAAGWYEVIQPKPGQMRQLSLPLEQVDPQTFIPSSRSLAFSRAAWQAVGGYPEWLTLTGEDTFFALELKQTCVHWAFVPEAVVEWQAPPNRTAYWRKVYSWSTGDGESGIDAWYYWRSFQRVSGVACLGLALAAALASILAPSPLSLWALVLFFLMGFLGLFALAAAGNLRSLQGLQFELGVEIARVAGFLKGAHSRPSAAARRYQPIQRVFFILSGVPIDDTGGGARCTQLALELLNQGNGVVFINRFPKYESSDLRLTIRRPNLWTFPLGEFRWKQFSREYGPLLVGRRLAALVEFPLGDFLPLIEQVHGAGGVVVYDLVDAWDTSLGSDWYSRENEQKIIDYSGVLVATEASLATRLERMSGRKAALLPNAVNDRLFDPRHVYPRPADYPDAEWSMIYIGALWGEWFDWELLARCAGSYPEAALVVVGDYRGQCENPPPNLHFLGLKAQRELPAYLAHAQVAIIPWKVSAITQATSPLKVYEYLAMRKPVVAPGLRPLQDLPGVFTTANSERFINKIGEVRGFIPPEEAVARFIEGNNWQARVEQLLELVRQAEASQAR